VSTSALWRSCQARVPRGSRPSSRDSTGLVTQSHCPRPELLALHERQLEVLDRLLDGIGAAIDEYGGSFVMNFETVLITATRLG
jgi:hypothetical protein